MKYSFIFLCSLFVLKSTLGFMHGIRIPDEIKEKIIEHLDPAVDIKQGTIQGSAELSRNGRVFLSFKGIPYGKVPRRFNNAQPADSWKGVRSAKAFGPICAQVNVLSKTFYGSEDCLSLNVFVPKTESKSEESLPVLVWIYGGVFLMGESKIYQPNYIMDEDVILVTLNYRVASFGFLNAGIKGASGNQGLKDMVLALKWVQENIGVFGGDVNKVTIFGESAGGAAVSHLVASPMSKGLFHAAISQSGVATIGWALYPDPEFDEPKKLAQAVDCPTSNLEYMVDCLRKVKPEILAEATDFRDSVWFQRMKTPVMAPGIEYYMGDGNDTVFLSKTTEAIFDEGTFNKVPFLIGVTSHEGLALHAAPIVLSPSNTKKVNEQWGRVAPEALFYWNLALDPCRVSTKLRNAYFQDRKINTENVDDLRQLYSDMGFEYPARKVGIKHARFAPVYFYNFTRNVKRSFVDLYGWKAKNVEAKPPTHGDDMQFLFNGLRLWPDIKKEMADYEFSTNYVKLWTSFAKTGKPSHIWGSQIEANTTILPVNATAEKHDWLLIDNELGVQTETEDFLERMRVLDEICRVDFDYCSSLNMK
ncbi:unnamed protein product [Orchesella dallaii]|uniref:Carboxylic ester hydrolase n=1 Tax=Orchesella dallaii TaxID=48710 RepID=A0ABP1RTA9_9HEXA